MLDASLQFSDSKFNIIVEVVPPSTSDLKFLISKLKLIDSLSIDGFSVATNPLAKPVMDALVSSFLLQESTEKPAILHCITRDENRLGLQSKLLGAKGLGVKTILAMTGDLISGGRGISFKAVNDIDVLTLISVAREIGLNTGVVIGRIDSNQRTIAYFQKKVKAGAQFVVTQPVYSFEDVETLNHITHSASIPVVMGIMPLQSIGHASFLDKKIEGIFIPPEVFARMSSAKNQMEEGLLIAREMLSLARKYFNGVCIMPPFNKFDLLRKILECEEDPI